MPISHPIAFYAIELKKANQKSQMVSLEKLEAALEQRAVGRLTWPMAELKPNNVAFIPYGHVPLITTVSEVADFLWLPWVSVETATRADSDIAELVTASFSKYLQHVSTQAPWSSVMPAWKEYRRVLDAGVGSD